MKHVAILMANYDIECSCGARFGSIQEWGDHRAEEAWDEGHSAGETDMFTHYMHGAGHPETPNPYRETETT